MSVSLAATEYGAGRPVAILHGLFGAARNWTAVARRLAADYRVIAFDLRNHGASGWADEMDYRAMAEDVRLAMCGRGHRAYALIGHSMGGKVAMVAALQDPAAVEKLIVVDVAPVRYDARYRSYVRAMLAVDLATVARRGDADAALASVVADPAERAFLLQNLMMDAAGPRWQLNLAALDATMPTIADFPALGGARYDGPALFIAGRRSPYLPPAHDRLVRTLFPGATIARLDAGHLVHVERAEEFLSLTQRFLRAGELAPPRDAD
ncbi:MAG: alpha/beta fold hydrolase [Alphaproteobacteria bacterium]|nr:alpha/beta fold hydrolase [Alphaproteobacteria bacterium]MBV9553053.1 alpha/beta fold hydrolase [Alphaproteobacteria bacterium]